MPLVETVYRILYEKVNPAQEMKILSEKLK
jgi:glycerol-3-phosphate dehydrogenase